MNSVITVTCSTLDRSVLLLLAAAVSLLFAVALLLGWEGHPETLKVAQILLYLAAMYLFVIISFRFVVRVDEKQFIRRDLIMTRSVSLDKLLSIRVSEERKLLGWISYLKIEIVGQEGRILVSWHKKKLEPLLEALRLRFPEKLEAVKSLPDV